MCGLRCHIRGRRRREGIQVRRHGEQKPDIGGRSYRSGRDQVVELDMAKRPLVICLEKTDLWCGRGARIRRPAGHSYSGARREALGRWSGGCTLPPRAPWPEVPEAPTWQASGALNTASERQWVARAALRWLSAEVDGGHWAAYAWVVRGSRHPL